MTVEKTCISSVGSITTKEFFAAVFVSIIIIVLVISYTGPERMCLNSPEPRAYLVVNQGSASCLKSNEHGVWQPIHYIAIESYTTLFLRSLGFVL